MIVAVAVSRRALFHQLAHGTHWYRLICWN